eukprot:TRINITY_DN332_c0_g1_i3.p2 TRINITY_DN332_c0_g1~~TRINITY_DN332_c0_g1_i3.p2  ORF type:complete len:587 (+),score=293.64 TRINITY_DN332_c0_g1_i3:233-1993(+)
MGLVDHLHGGGAGGGGGGNGHGLGLGVVLGTELKAKLDHAVDALGVGSGVLEVEAGGEEGGVEEQVDEVLDGLVALVGVDALAQLLDDGVVGVDLHGLLGHHVGGHAGVAEGLVAHDLLHVGGPAELGGDENAGGGGQTLGQHNLLDLLGEDLLHLLAQLVVGGLVLLALLLLLLGLVELDALLGQAHELEVLEVLHLLHDVLVDGVNHEENLNVAALGLLEEGGVLELLLAVAGDVVDGLLVLAHAGHVVLEGGGLLGGLGGVVAKELAQLLAVGGVLVDAQLEVLAENKEDYEKFYEQFGKNLKLGIHEDSANRKKLCELLRYHSTKATEEPTALKDYVTRMGENQKSIYYITGDSKKKLENSPFLEEAKRRDVEVLFMVDPIDEYVMQQVKDFEDFKFVCLTKEGVKFDESEEEKKQREEDKAAYDKLCKQMKEILTEKVEKVVLTERLSTSPCILITSEFGWSAHMEQIMRNQALRDSSMSSYMVSKKTMEINPHHPIVKELRKRVDADQSDKTVKDLVYLLFDTALLTSGFNLEDPTTYAERIHRMIKLGLELGAEDDAESEPVPVAAAPATGTSSMEMVD